MELVQEYLLKPKVVVPIVVILVCFLLCVLSKKIVHKIFNFKGLKKIDNRKKTIINLITNIITGIIIVLGILIILETFNVNTGSLITSLGLVGLVAGLAIQDMLKDLIVGINIILEGQYSIGDWVTVNSFNNTFKGQVLPSSLRTTKIKAYTGEVKIIYNRNITDIINYSLENTNLVIDIDVKTDTDIEKTKRVLDDLCVELKRKYKLMNIFCAGVHEITTSSIKFRVVALSRFSEQFRLDSDLKKEILLALENNDIKIP